MQCVDGFSVYNKGMLEKVTTQRTQQFLTIQSLEFQEIWQKISSETT